MAKTHIYFVPGLAAGTEIFRNIRLPEEAFTIHILEWLIPLSVDEELSHYAERMAERVVEPNAILVGVSFGGVVVQEMAAFLNLKNLVIISSVKTKEELPKRLKIARKTGAYKLVPTSIVLSAPDLRKFAIGPKSRKRLALYQEYLSVRDKVYLDWAIANMVCWDRSVPNNDVIHIHGDEDIVFPMKNIQDCRVLTGGTHIMILNKGSVITAMLQEIAEKY